MVHGVWGLAVQHATRNPRVTCSPVMFDFCHHLDGVALRSLEAPARWARVGVSAADKWPGELVRLIASGVLPPAGVLAFRVEGELAPPSTLALALPRST